MLITGVQPGMSKNILVFTSYPIGDMKEIRTMSKSEMTTKDSIKSRLKLTGWEVKPRQEEEKQKSSEATLVKNKAMSCYYIKEVSWDFIKDRWNIQIVQLF